MRASAAAIVLILLLFVPAQAQIEEGGVKVAVFPFTFYSREDLSHLAKPLMLLINKRLAREGMESVDLGEVLGVMGGLRPADLNDERASEMGRMLGAGFAIYGSLTKVGERISLDVRVVDTSRLRKSAPIYVEQMGLENLGKASEKMAKEVGIKVFRKAKIYRINVLGSKRIEKDAVRMAIRTRPGDIYNPRVLSDDLKVIHKMGYFKDVKLDVSDHPQGKLVTFIVEEKASIKEIVFQGAEEIDEEDLRAAISSKPYTILNRDRLVADVEKIKSLYREDGYFNAEVEYEIKPLKENETKVTFVIDENEKLYIEAITFTGVKQVDPDDLLGVMSIKEKGWFWLFTGSGILKKDELELDTDRLAAYYYNNGYIDAQVGTPKVTHDEEGIYIDVPVVEGKRYRVGKVGIDGDFVGEKDELMEELELPEEEYYNRKVMREDMNQLTTGQADKGYAFADVSPKIDQDEEKGLVNVTYQVKKGEKVYFERITISGNFKTRDKVIRRELKIKEQGLYSSTHMKKSRVNLQRLEYFEDVKFTTAKGTREDTMNVNIAVLERETGAFSIGAGYSSWDNMFAMAEVSQRNFMGTGIKLSLKGYVAAKGLRYQLSVIEPWLFGIPLSAGFDAFHWTHDYGEFKRRSNGFNVSFSYPIFEDVKAHLKYTFDASEVYSLQPLVSAFIKRMEGDIDKSAIMVGLERDTRDHLFLATEGSQNEFYVEYSGEPYLGGDTAYTKYIFNTGWYFPLFWKTVGFLHGRAGYLEGREGLFTPIYERFFLGGINSIRAFNYGEVGPKDPATGNRIGGNKMILFNAEFLFPIAGDVGVRGVLFYDTGQAYNNNETVDIGKVRHSVGIGLRWYSPLGPLRLEYGWNPDPRTGEPRDNWEFSMGLFF